MSIHQIKVCIILFYFGRLCSIIWSAYIFVDGTRRRPLSSVYDNQYTQCETWPPPCHSHRYCQLSSVIGHHSTLPSLLSRWTRIAAWQGAEGRATSDDTSSIEFAATSTEPAEVRSDNKTRVNISFVVGKMRVYCRFLHRGGGGVSPRPTQSEDENCAAPTQVGVGHTVWSPRAPFAHQIRCAARFAV